MLPSENNIVIKVQSTNGEGHYFRAFIYVDDELFDEQGWSRIDAYTAAKDLKKIYSAYFAPVWNPAFANLLQLQTHLKKKISITVKEYNLDSGEQTGELELPDFRIIYTQKPVDLDDGLKIQLLGMDAKTMVVPANGKIVVPFMVSAVDEQVKVQLRDSFGTLINEQAVEHVSKVQTLLYQYQLTDSYNPDTLYFTVHIFCGIQQLATPLVYRMNKLPDFPFKEIAFQNNFGYYLYAYPDGEMEISNAFDVETYETADGLEKVFEINEEATYTINTGSYTNKEKAIINMIANSVDSKLKNGSTWLDMVARTKKQLEHRDHKHNYSEALQFGVRKGTNVESTGFIAVEPSFPSLHISNVTVAGHLVTVNFGRYNGYNPRTLLLQVRTSPFVPWKTVEGSVNSPRTISLPTGPWQVRLKDTLELTPVSEIHDVMID